MPARRGTARTYRCPPDHKHATTGTCYNQHGCGCGDCVEGRRVYELTKYRLRAFGRWNRPSTIDATGTRRRIQALAYMGWSSAALAVLLKTTQAQVSALRYAERVQPRTARRVRDVFARIWDVEPVGGRSARTMNHARRRGWVGPLDWDDIDNDPEPSIVADDESVPGASIIEDIEWLLAGGMSAHLVAEHLRKKPATIARFAERYDRRDIARKFENLDRGAAA